MRAVRYAAFLLLTGFIAFGRVSAQEETRGFTHGTTLTALVGIAVDDVETGPVAGAGFGWEITPRFAIEGSGLWLDRGAGANAYAADLNALVTLVAPQRIAPFVRGGIGVYGASFDVIDSPIPEFYRKRIVEHLAGFGQRVSFSDPAFVLGAGVNTWFTAHVSVRPDVELRGVWQDSDVHWLTTVAVRLAYHFEEHPLSARRGSFEKR
jgi:hypothetical protein